MVVMIIPDSHLNVWIAWKKLTSSFFKGGVFRYEWRNCEVPVFYILIIWFHICSSITWKLVCQKKEYKQSDFPVSTHKIIINLLQSCNETYEHGPQEITRWGFVPFSQIPFAVMYFLCILNHSNHCLLVHVSLYVILWNINNSIWFCVFSEHLKLF